MFKPTVVNRVIALGLSFVLICPFFTWAQGFERIPVSEQSGAPAGRRFFSNQWVILAPDLLAGRHAWDEMKRHLRAGGILPQNILDLAYVPGFTPRLGLAQQGELLARVAAEGAALRGGVKAHIIAQGSGCLAARWAQQGGDFQRETPAQTVLSLDEPAQGSYWAYWVYLLYLPLPRLGVRAPSLRDLARGSKFLQALRVRETRDLANLQACRALYQEVLEGTRGAFRIALEKELQGVDLAKQAWGQKALVWARYPEQVALSPGDAQRVRHWEATAQALEQASALFEGKDAGEVSSGQLEEAIEKLGRAAPARAEAPAQRSRPSSPATGAMGVSVPEIDRLDQTLHHLEKQILGELAQALIPVRHPGENRGPESFSKSKALDSGFRRNDGQVMGEAQGEREKFIAPLVAKAESENHFSAFLNAAEAKLAVALARLQAARQPGLLLPSPAQVEALAMALDAEQAAWVGSWFNAGMERGDLKYHEAAKQVQRFSRVQAQVRAQGLAKQAALWENAAALRQAWEALQNSREAWLQACEDWRQEAAFSVLVQGRPAGSFLPLSPAPYYARYVDERNAFQALAGRVTVHPENFPAVNPELDVLRIYIERLADVEDKIMAQAAAPEAFTEGLGYLAGGGASRERAFFAQGFEKKLSLEMAGLEEVIQKHENQASASSQLKAEARACLSEETEKALAAWQERERAYQQSYQQAWDALKAKPALDLRQRQLRQARQALAGARAALEANEQVRIKMQATLAELARNQAGPSLKPPLTASPTLARVGNAVELDEQGALGKYLMDATEWRSQMEQRLNLLQAQRDVFFSHDWTSWAGTLEAMRLSEKPGAAWTWVGVQEQAARQADAQIQQIQKRYQSALEQEAKTRRTVEAWLQAARQVEIKRRELKLKALNFQVHWAHIEARHIRQLEESAGRQETLQDQAAAYAQTAQALQAAAVQAPSVAQALAQVRAAAAELQACKPELLQREIARARQAYAAHRGKIQVLAARAAQDLAQAPIHARSPGDPAELASTLATLAQGPASIEDWARIEQKMQQSASETASSPVAFVLMAQERLETVRQAQAAEAMREPMDASDARLAIADARKAGRLDALQAAAAQVQDAFDALGGKTKRELENAQFGKSLHELVLKQEKLNLGTEMACGEAAARLRAREMLMPAGLNYAGARLESLLAARGSELGKTRQKELTVIFQALVKNSSQAQAAIAEQVSHRLEGVLQARLSRQVQAALSRLKQINSEVRQGKEISRDWWNAQTAALARAAGQGRAEEQKGAAFFQQRQMREQRSAIQAQAEAHCDQAQSLMDRQVALLTSKISAFASQDTGLGANTQNYLRAKAMAGVKNQLNQQVQNLERMKASLGQELAHQIAELKAADAVAWFQALAQKYGSLDFSTLTKNALSAQNAFNQPDWSSLAADNEVMQSLRRDAFANLIASNPALQEMQRLGDIRGEFDAAMAQGGEEAKRWFAGTQLGKHLDRLNQLREEAKAWMDATLDQNAGELASRLAQGELGSILKRWGVETQYIDAAVGLASESLKQYLKSSELMAAVERYTNVQGLLSEQFDGLIAQVQAYVSAGQFMQSLDGLGKDITDLWAQITGEKPLDLDAWLAQVSGHFDAFKKWEEQFSEQAQAWFEKLGLSNDAPAIFQHMEEQLRQVTANLGQSLQTCVAVVLNGELYAGDIINFSGNPLNNLAQYLRRFEFRSDALWENLSQLINSPNWKLDFAENAAGLMQGLSGQVHKGVAWVGDRLAEVRQGYDLVMGGPDRWMEELSKADWKTASHALDQFIPEKYRAAKSALDAAVFDKDYLAAAEHLSVYAGKNAQKYVHTCVALYRIYEALNKKDAKYDAVDYITMALAALDLLSDYLDADARAKYKEYAKYAQKAMQAWKAGKAIYNAIKGVKGSDWGSAIQSAAELIPAPQLVMGPVYKYGQGRAAHAGGVTEPWAQRTQEIRKQKIDSALAKDEQAKAGISWNNSGFIAAGEEDLAGELSQYANTWEAREAEYSQANAARAAARAQGITFSGAYDSRVFTGQMSAAQAQAEREAWAAQRNGTSSLGTNQQNRKNRSQGSRQARVPTSPRPPNISTSLWDRARGVLAEDAKTLADPRRLIAKGGKGLGGKSAQAAGRVMAERAGDTAAFAKGALEGVTAENGKSYWPVHKAANQATQKTREAVNRLQSDLDQVEASARKNKKGLAKYDKIIKTKVIKAGVTAGGVLIEGALDIPKIGEDTPDALANSKKAYQAWKKGNKKEAFQAAGKAVGLFGREAARAGGVLGVGKGLVKASAGIAGILERKTIKEVGVLWSEFKVNKEIGKGTLSEFKQLGGETEIVERAMSKKELEATRSSGLLRGGRVIGDHYVSDNVNSAAQRARQKLALPQTPEVKVKLEVPKNIFPEGRKVVPKFNMPGGGSERSISASEKIPVEILNVQEFK